ADRNGMLLEKQSEPLHLGERDVLDYLALQNVARLLEYPDTIEYWKSAPFVLNFMDDGYKLKRELDGALEDPQRRTALAGALSAGPTAILAWEQIDQYTELDPGNGRLRALLDDTVARGAHRMLWIPPSLPYYQPAGVFAEPGVQGFTKRLVFSSWRLVPRAIAACLSYEAERRMVGRAGVGANTPAARHRRTPLLRLARADGRLTGMPVLALMYPSAYLARAGDPAQLAKTSADGTDVSRVDASRVLREAESIIEVALQRLPIAPMSDGPEDERWYWAAPLLLDQALEPAATKAWFAQPGLAALWAGQRKAVEPPPVPDEDADTAAWGEHVQEACEFATGRGAPLGRVPTDLVQILARIAIAAPGVTMLRALLRVVGMRPEALAGEAGVRVRNGSAQAAWSFRHLFNQAEVMALLEGKPPYWRQVLDYCVDGCLQAVLDEYAHVLHDHLGLGEGVAAQRVHEIATHICEAMSLRTANLGVSDLGLGDSLSTKRPQTRRMRCHFALRFGDERAEDGKMATRADSVRKAFNSPFWPFVVATTSVGQEGLDFHTYCHAVVHWNLPSNPVDLEQREGRVHRFKGHAVRKNIALAHGTRSLEDGAIDPWKEMFDEASRTRPDGATDIIPFWVYVVEGGARIERHVPAFPLSREHAQLRALSRSLVTYRMVFGQPRQDDLLAYLMTRLDPEGLGQMLESARIDLSPGWTGGGVAP
ncbi:MAG: helicase-related protein, partial [Deltaproteobacteria bacterium]